MAELGPLPGDPDVVLRDATQYLRTAEAIAQAAEQLRQLSGDGFRSHAVSALVSSAGDAASSITQAHARYDEASQALLEYVRPMRDAHDRARMLTAASHDLTYRADEVRARFVEADQQAQLPGPEQPAALARAEQLRAEWDQLQRELSQAETEWNAARDQLRHAASVAAARIHRGNEFGDLNDSFWDDLGDLFDIVQLVANILSVVLKIVSLVLTVLAVVFAVLAVVMPLFAAVAAALFGYAQLVNIAIAVLALLQFALNGFHLLDLVVAGLAVLAAFGGAALGGALGAAAKSAAAGATRIVGEAASSAIGEIAKQAVAKGIEAVTDTVVDGVLSLGGSEARSIYDSLNPLAGDFLDATFGSGVDSFTSTMEGLGEKVGADFAEGIDASGLGAAITAAADFGRPAAAALGTAFDSVYTTGSSIADAVGRAASSVQQTLDQAARDALAPLAGSGFEHVADRLQHDLGSVLGGPDVSDKVGNLVSGALGDVIGGVPGGDQLAQAAGDGFGGLAQRLHDAAVDPKLAAVATGGGGRG
ncbi:hypothetical protein SCB71_14040 [Herbiconiux sp. KACC 21604]|uniref:hypothetical protein n=1 Tax=unclassified Herbiconiux TaxID=2618217 RepID=UPI0014916A10|nr:hypothetical protein [Herbiconiux sp. SALV-R1]QJU54265.1 hypothetical protein HL652_11985 [Herbiconiux sp. SALV-R1]WPO85332.1 hypothetical protein SCB71_14040 [Herbiconiux sp. KACC 21604]